MATFTKADQSKHRKALIEECHQKAWGAACHADWVSKGIDELLASFQRLQEEDRILETDIKESEQALDYHTVATAKSAKPCRNGATDQRDK